MWQEVAWFILETVIIHPPYPLPHPDFPLTYLNSLSYHNEHHRVKATTKQALYKLHGQQDPDSVTNAYTDAELFMGDSRGQSQLSPQRLVRGK